MHPPLLLTFSPTISLRQLFTGVDYAIFIFLFFLTALSVFLANRAQTKEEQENPTPLQYLLMGRQLTLPLFVGTLVATWYGDIIGVTQFAFKKGIYNFLTQGVFWYFTYMIFALFMVKRLRRVDAITLPEMVGKIFGPNARKVAILFTFFKAVPLTYTISLGLFIQLIFGYSLVTSMGIGLFALIFYSWSGGFRAIIISDFVQFILMLSSVFFVLLFSVIHYEGFGVLWEELPPSHLSPLGDQSLSSAFVWGFIALGTLINPAFCQRCLAAKSDRVARNGIFISTLIWICFDICTTLGALYARVAMPDAESTQAYLIYAAQLLPSGLRGFVFAGFLATILSTVDSYLFVAATTFSYDLAPKGRKYGVRYHHMCMIGIGVACLIVGQYFSGTLLSIKKLISSAITAGVLLPILIGLRWPKAIGDRTFVLASVSGVTTLLLWHFGYRYPPLADLHGFYPGVAATALVLLLSSIYRKYLSAK